MMKRMNWIKCVVAASLCLTATSCKKDTGSTPEEEFVDNFKALVMGSKEIDSHQDWNTVGNANVNITVDYGNDAEYTVYISQSPLIFDTNAVYIGMAKLKSGESKTISIARPANSPLLYAACYDANGHAVSKPFPVKEGTSELSFTGKSPSQAYAFTPTIGNNWSVPVRELPDLSAYTSGTLVNPTDEVELDDEHEVHFQVNSDFTGFIPSLGTFAKKSVYVTATWTLTFNQQVLRDNVLIVGAGGKIVVPEEFKLTTCPVADENTGLIYVLPGGEITGDGVVEFATNSGTFSYNGGTITAKNINLYGCTLYNSGTIGKIDVTETSMACFVDNSGIPCTLSNIGNTFLEEITGDNFSIENAGYLKVNGGLVLNSSSKMDDGSYTECASLTLNGDTNGENVLYMGNAAYLNCLGDISIDNYGVQGPSGSEFKANAILQFNNCTYCATTDGVAGTYLLDHVELILPSNFPTIFDDGAINVYEGDKRGVGIGKLQDTFSGYQNLRMLFYWMNGCEGRSLDVANYQWKLLEEKYCFVGTDAATAANGIDASRQTCTYSTSPSYNSNRFRSQSTGSTPSIGCIYYLFETLESSTKDFDYNDVVLRVSTPIDQGDGTYYANVQIMCVGNKVKTTVYYNGVEFGEEVHAAIGTAVTTPVNNTTVNRVFRKLGEITFNDGNCRIDKLNLALNVENEKGEATLEQQPTSLGVAPLYIVVNGDRVGKWFWPIESNNIGIAYPEFSNWGSNVQVAIDWYDSSNAVSSKIVSY